MVKVQIAIRKILWKTDFLYPAAIWLASRIFIWIAMLLVAPRIPLPADAFVPRFGWEVFDAWDSIHYRAIATSGYEFVDDGNQHNLAFFPLFPLSLWVLMKLGLRFELAGILVNNLAFFAALYCLYFWIKEHYGNSAAQWVSAVVCCYPSSMFTTVIYTEGLYLFLSTAALRAFDDKQYRWTAFWGAMATATRPTGMALIPALAIAAWKERRPPIAYIATFATTIGILLFSLYCAIDFGHPLAFIQAQRGWRPSFGFDWQGWLNMLMQILVGSKNWEFGWVQNPSGGIQDPWYPLLVAIIISAGYLLWRFQKHSISGKLVYGFYALIVFLLVLASEQWMNNLLNLFMVLGGAFVLWRLHRQLTTVTVTYGFCGIGLLLASGGTISLSRLAYGIIPLSIAIGLFLSRHPRQGYFILGLFVTLLAKIAVGFAQEHWVG
ncbi:membrane protein [Nostoc linckia z18]|uniref:Membrane protein n=2 Tax=Nostoc linckia TaxID=92942 RepID=A0A9Q5Z5D9_NOSLI|nr:mannosyltransferase family protein [Nostoc linckia]PHK37939.1 membrane protein [Nostoc linckia z15]PHK42715.1 membrane protein [Nostoc linckia z16]PHJ57877.1 membrane protein [Nostoc linckia z1]PHJ60527.1 membrane protein [Nostoc linckia z3]PHJ62126.1 membrane protein [Nostoc linckia z2]